MLLPLPCRYEGIISLLCENLDTLDEPEAKAAMVWVLGEPPGASRVVSLASAARRAT